MKAAKPRKRVGSAVHRVTLTADCTARQAATLHASLLGKLETPDEICIDVDAVERIDTACLQLLTAFVRERAQHGRPCAWQGRSDAFGQAARLLGLETALGLPV